MNLSSPSMPDGVDGWGKRRPLDHRAMTAIVGVVTPYSAILASDSQETFEGGTVRRDLVKIFEIPVLSGVALVGVAGETLRTDILLDLIRQGPVAPTGNDCTVEDFLSDAMRRTMAKTKAPSFEGMSHAEYERWQTFESPRCSALVAYISTNGPTLFSIHPDGVARKAKNGYEAIGSGEAVAKHFLNYNFKPGMNGDVACAVAIYAVEVAKENTNACSGPVQCAITEMVFNPWKPDATPTASVAFVPTERVEEITKIVSLQEAAAKKERDRKIEELMRPIGRPTLAQVLAEQLSKNQK